MPSAPDNISNLPSLRKYKIVLAICPGNNQDHNHSNSPICLSAMALVYLAIKPVPIITANHSANQRQIQHHIHQQTRPCPYNSHLVTIPTSSRFTAGNNNSCPSSIPNLHHCQVKAQACPASIIDTKISAQQHVQSIAIINRYAISNASGVKYV